MRAFVAVVVALVIGVAAGFGAGYAVGDNNHPSNNHGGWGSAATR